MQMMKAEHEQNDIVPLKIWAVIMAKNFDVENMMVASVAMEVKG